MNRRSTHTHTPPRNETSGGRTNPGKLSPAQTLFIDGNFTGLIVDENGLDVFYWRRLEELKKKSRLQRKNYQSGKKLNWISKGKPSPSSSDGQNYPGNGGFNPQFWPLSDGQSFQDVGTEDGRNNGGGGGRVMMSSALVEAMRQQLEQQGFNPLLALAKDQKQTNPTPAGQPPPSSVPEKTDPIPSPPTPPPPAPPPPPPPKNPAAAPPPPPPPKAKSGGTGSSKPPPAPPTLKRSGGSKSSASVEDGEGSGNGKDQVKMKPLHWEKVNVNTDYSVVWNELEEAGSFRYNEDIIEAMFGVVATDKKSANDNNQHDHNSENTDPNAKTFILQPRKSQNTSIVLRSLGIPRDELIDSLHEGKGLSLEKLEKLTRLAPTREEQQEILEFDGEPTKLADAENFLYHLLKAVPNAFTRTNAMLFRVNYDSEINGLKESLQTMESACQELRSRGIFIKLLDAILKAGNTLNAGTAKGGAKAFNLTTLLKLSDYKTSDGKNTLLHFVVNEVVQREGKRCVLAQKNSLVASQTNQGEDSSSVQTSDNPTSKEEQEKEYLKLGLPVVKGLSDEFSNVKKAAVIDNAALASTLASLTTRVFETRQVMAKCEADRDSGGFLTEMEGFLVAAEAELQKMKEENERVMNLVKKTTQYYQAGACNDKIPLQLFIIVKDFLGLVVQVCNDIGRTLQQKKPAVNQTATTSSGNSSEGANQTNVLRTSVVVPKLLAHFSQNDFSSSSSDSDDEET